jgi:heme/copper-type cytochrome/quinol oxidase subunit 3
MGAIVPYPPPRARQEWTAYLGMVIFLGSWAMMFGSLFFAYGMVRARANEWPPSDLPELPLGLPGFNTALLGASSAILQLGVRWLRTGKTSLAGPAVGASLALGALFVSLQAVTWERLLDEGLTPSGGPYGSVFYALTCFHALHVVVGLVALAFICRGVFTGKYTAARFLTVRLWTLYWHFVGAVWGVMFFTVYVL